MSSAQQFPEFLRMHGIIRVAELADPEPVLVKRLPVASSIHYLGDDVNPKLDTSDPLMLGYSERVRYHNVTNYDPEHTGGMRKLVNMTQINAIFDKQNPGFKVMRELKDVAMMSNKQLLALNYGYLDQLYRYTETKVSEFQKLENKLWAVISTIKEINTLSNRQHFIMLDIPTMLIPKTVLDQRSLDNDLKLATIFKTMDQHLLRHMWLFLNPVNMSRSIWGSLTDDQKKCVNLVWRTFDGKCVVVNLGYLYSWVTEKGRPNLTLMKTPQTKEYAEVQKTFLRGSMVLQTINANGASERAQEEAQNEQAKKLEQEDISAEEASEKDDRFLQDREFDQAAVQDEAQLRKISNQLRDDKGEDAVKPAPSVSDTAAQESDKVTEETINEDISALEEVYRRQMSSITSAVKKKAKAESSPDDAIIDETVPEEGYTSEVAESSEEIRASLFTSRTPEQALLHKLDKLVDEGRLSGVEYRKKAELIRKAANLPDPYGSGQTIGKASVVTKEDLSITDEEAALIVPATVIDKSMARASLGVLAEKYNTKTIYKDVLAAVQHAQKGGVVIRNHQVDTRHEITGSYDIHTLEIVPLNGQPSLIRCKIPLVSEEGNFVAKGSSYVLRKQIVD